MRFYRSGLLFAALTWPAWGQPGFADGAAAVARFSGPRVIAFDSQGNLYVADTVNNRIRKITPAGAASTFAGNGTAGFGGEGSLASAAQVAFPDALAMRNNTLCIGDTSNGRVRAVALSNSTITTAAGGGSSSTFDGLRPNRVNPGRTMAVQ